MGRTLGPACTARSRGIPCRPRTPKARSSVHRGRNFRRAGCSLIVGDWQDAVSLPATRPDGWGVCQLLRRKCRLSGGARPLGAAAWLDLSCSAERFAVAFPFRSQRQRKSRATGCAVSSTARTYALGKGRRVTGAGPEGRCGRRSWGGLTPGREVDAASEQNLRISARSAWAGYAIPVGRRIERFPRRNQATLVPLCSLR